MSASPKADSLRTFPGRASKGPLYTKRELAKIEAFLGADGYRHVEDMPDLGMRIYGRERVVHAAGYPIDLRDEVHLYLDEIRPTAQSGGVVLARSVKISNEWKGVGGFETDTIWDFVRRRDREIGVSLPQRILESVRCFGQFLTLK